MHMLANARQHYLSKLFFAEMYFFATCFGTDLLMVAERSQDITNAFETSQKLSGETFERLRM